MKIIKILGIILSCTILMFTIGCNKKSETTTTDEKVAETTGDKIIAAGEKITAVGEDAAKATGEKITAAGEKVAEAMHETKEKVKEKIEQIRKNPPIKESERTLLIVPSDSKATYYILEREGQYPIRSIVTEREGSSGLNFTKRQCDCSNNTYKEIFTGETEKEIEASKTGSIKAVELLPGSIAFYICEAACKK